MPISTALIVEPRSHPASLPALKNVRENLGPDVPIIWFHGTDNKEFAENIANEVSNVRLREISVNNLSRGQYSGFINNQALWKEMKHYSHHCPNSKTLLFQTDSGFCQYDTEKALNALKELDHLDYVGAFATTHQNGGFSYRDNEASRRIVADYKQEEYLEDDDSGLWDSGYWLTEWKPTKKGVEEDRVFSAHCNERTNCQKANQDEATSFACCTVRGPHSKADSQFEPPLAFHGHHHHFIGRGQPWKNLQEFFEDCPAAADIFGHLKQFQK